MDSFLFFRDIKRGQILFCFLYYNYHLELSVFRARQWQNQAVASTSGRLCRVLASVMMK
jgi:hypothetical protein